MPGDHVDRVLVAPEIDAVLAAQGVADEEVRVGVIKVREVLAPLLVQGGAHDVSGVSRYYNPA